MSVQVKILLVAGVLMIAGLLAFKLAGAGRVHTQPVAAAVAQPASTPAPVNQTDAKKSPLPADASRILRIQPDEVLATVNGHPLTLSDVVATQGTNEQDVSAMDLKYLLSRAVDRELIHETAKAQGVFLDDSQQAQLSQFHTTRMDSEPGLIQRLNADTSGDNFEMQDAEAFMLQTSLLAKAGYSPDVTADEVNQYYAQHAADFNGLSTDEADYQIRNLLAPIERQNYQNQLNTYMNQMRSAANINFATAL